MSHILSLTDLTHAVTAWRQEGASIVLAAGCFDPLHAGHVQHLQEARKLGNVLIVAVTGDQFVGKGPSRPRIKAEHRAEVVAALRDVDAVIVNDDVNTATIIEAIQPHYFVKGSEYATNMTPKLREEMDAVLAYGGTVRFGSGRTVLSSTAILGGEVRDGKL
jgi:rfaE bifunctional protein nucleotidyltransferase chain/domain